LFGPQEKNSSSNGRVEPISAKGDLPLDLLCRRCSPREDLLSCPGNERCGTPQINIAFD
jgi:hypothetical protein